MNRSLAAAAFMILDGNLPGENIIILEAASDMGGSLDAAGDPDQCYSMRGGRMMTTDNFECTWDLFKSIPSRCDAGKTVFDETVKFNDLHKSHSSARLVDSWRTKMPMTSMEGSPCKTVPAFAGASRCEEPGVYQSVRRDS